VSQDRPLSTGAPPVDHHVDDWFRRERPRLMDFIVHQADNRSEAEDIVQETLLRAASFGVDGIEKPATWLRAIARNVMADGYRRRTAARRGGAGTRTVPAAEIDENAVWNSVVETRGQPEVDEYLHVRDQLRQLGPAARHAAYLLIFEQYAEREVLSEMGASRSEFNKWRKEIETAIFGPELAEQPAGAAERRPM
jgi:DNA-directed RNA polymerase specialized sigma24 family protein